MLILLYNLKLVSGKFQVEESFCETVIGKAAAMLGTLSRPGTDLHFSSLDYWVYSFSGPFSFQLKDYHFICVPSRFHICLSKMSKCKSTSFFYLLTLYCLSKDCRTVQIPSSVVSPRNTSLFNHSTPTLLHHIFAQSSYQNLMTRSLGSTTLKNKTLIWNADFRAPHPYFQIQHVCTEPRSLNS